MKIGLIGFGAIGSFLGKKLKEKIKWVVDSDSKVKEKMRRLGLKCPFYNKIPKDPNVELVVEAASQEAVKELINCLKKTDIMILSVGALADEKLRKKLFLTAKKYKRKIYIPSGAIGGFDAILSAKEKISSIVLQTTKNPKSFGRNDKKKVVIFEGNAADACRLYTKNINVAATLSLAAAGFEKTTIRLVSDPKEKNNRHEIFVKSKIGDMYFEFRNVPFEENPKTSALAAYSALERIKKMDREIIIG